MSKFIPVLGTKEKVSAQAITEGFTYFETDTGRIFVDVDGERIAFGGGGVQILYADSKNVTESFFDETYYIPLADLDDKEAQPSENDLIINKDGRFFKILYVDRNEGSINCSLIAVSGTGGNTGGGDVPGGNDPEQKITLEAIDAVRGPYIFGQSAYICYKAVAPKDYNITYTITIETQGSKPKIIQRSSTSGAEFKFDLGPELFKGLNKIIIAVNTDNSGSTSLTYRNVNCIEMLLKESVNFNPLSVVNGELLFYCRPVGSGLTKTLKIYIDGDIRNDLTQTVTSSEQDVRISILGLSHGAHTIKAVLSTGEGTTEVSATPLLYEIAYAQDGKEDPIIWLQNYPSEIVDHDKLILKYKVYNPKDAARAEVHLYRNQEEIPTSPVEVEYLTDNLVWEQWAITNYEVGTNIFTITCGNISRDIEILVKKDELRDLNVIDTGLLLFLDSKGRSNKENKTSREKWSYTTKDGKKTTDVTFNNFNWYNNGWIIDDNGDSCLRISNGANISIPLDVLPTASLATPLTFEFQFKLRNVQNLATLITTRSYEDENGELKIEKDIHIEEGVFARYFAKNIGFCLGTQEAFLKSGGNSIVNARYTDNEMVYLSFVIEKTNNKPLIYIYLNGVLSGISSYPSTDSWASQEVALTFNSNYCDVDLYKVRVYQVQLPMIDIVHNYIADRGDADLYDVNQIVEFSNNIPKVNFTSVQDYNVIHPDSPTLPYAILEISQEDKNPNDERLPFVKDGKRKVDVTFVNPSLDRAYELGEIDGHKYLTGCPSFRAIGASFDVQGTSSQGYPRRNYKGKFKDVDWTYTYGPLEGKSLNEKNVYDGKEYKKYYMDNKDAAESTFTWKADFMESSMTHNTGFASFVKTLYSKHPLNDYLSDYVMGDHRTTVYGFPMMVFQKYHNGTYEFIGRYNFNLDKGCNAVIDFENGSNHPFVPGKKIEEVAECWELCNNQHTRCSFKEVNFAETNDSGVLTVLDDFEYRYHIDEDMIDAAIENDTEKFPTQEGRNNYLLQKYANLEKLCLWLESTDSAKATNEAFEEPITFEAHGVQETFEADTPEYRRAKFTYEFTKHFDPEYCYIYFILTELLLQYDSRGKNMMLATWGPKEEGGEYIWYPIFYDIDTQLGVNNSGVPTWEYDTEATRDDQFSTADSVLWNNLWFSFSQPIKTKYIELRKSSLTIENLDGYYDFNPEVSKSYAMKGARPINVINIDEYFKYIAPEFGGYIDTSGNVAQTDLYFYCLQGTRALQRKMFLRNRFNYIDSQWLGGSYSREAVLQELKMRYNANDAMNTSDKFVTQQPTITTPEEQAKWDAFVANGGTIKPYKESPLDADANFTIEPYLKQYVSVFFDDTPTDPVYYDGENSVVVMPTASRQTAIETSPSYSQQLVYLGGVEYISKFGDLSLKYLNEFAMNKAIRLKELYLGNDIAGYRNGVMKDEAFSLAAHKRMTDKDGNEIENPLGKPLLETVVLTNIDTLTSPQDLTSCEKLKTFRALGTNIGGVTLADGVPIETLYLPESITYFNLKEPVSLNNVLTTVPVKDEKGEFPKGLYIKNVTDNTNILPTSTTNINSINIQGGNMGYLSYNLLDTLIKIKEAMQGNEELGDKFNKELRINMENVNWSPYRLVGEGEEFIEDATYVLKTEHYTFEPYTVDSNWNNHTLNGRVYEYDASAAKETITSLDMLDKFIASYNSSDNFFKSTVEYPDRRKTIPYISGNLFINNSSIKPISEAKLKNVYKDSKHFPDLNIFVAYAEESYVAKFVEVLDSGKEKECGILKYDPTGEVKYPLASDIEAIVPTKAHHDFIGWATTPDAKEDEIITDFSQFKFTDNNKVYIFYAIYKKTKYNISFYNHDGTQLLNKEPILVEYGQNLFDPGLIPYRDPSNLAEDQRYRFRGYSLEKNTELKNESEAKDKLKVLEDMVAIKDWNFYAVYTIESVYTNATDEKYFNFIPLEEIIVNGQEYKGIEISLKEEYRSELAGKITLPNVDPNGNPIISVGIIKAPKVTDVFFIDKDNSNYIRVGDNCFSRETNEPLYKLKNIYLPNSILLIGANAFLNCTKLENAHLGNKLVLIGTKAFSNDDIFNQSVLNINELPDSIQSIGESAFYRQGNGIKISKLPFNLKIIGKSAFRGGLSNVIVTEFGGKLESIGETAFYDAGSEFRGHFIIIRETVQTIGNNAFGGLDPVLSTSYQYGKGKIKEVRIEKDSYDTLDLGFGEDVNIVWGYKPDTEVID